MSTRQGRPKIYVYDDGRALWDGLLGLWRSDEEATLVLPGHVARERFLRRQAETTLWGRRTITILDLWSELAAALRHGVQLPTELLAPEVAPLLGELIATIPALAPLAEHRSGVDALARHLDEIEKRADLDYAPQTEVERGIQTLRRRLAERNVAVMSGHRSALAREAKHAELGRRLIFPPLPDLTPQLGGLLKGLARQNPVDAFLLCNEGQLPALLARTGLDTEQAEISTRFDRAPAAYLFSEHTAPEADRGFAEWALADDEVEAALEIVGRWIGDGVEPEQIALVCQNTEAMGLRIAREAELRGIPVLIRDAVTTRETQIGALLLAIAGADLQAEEERERLLTGDGEILGLQEQDLQAVAEARTVDAVAELQELYELGRRLATPESGMVADEFSRAHVWLDGLARTLAAIAQLDVHVDDVEELVAANESPRQMRGEADGVLLCSYAEVPSFQLRCACLLELSEDGYPPAAHPSPFVSDKLLAVCPALAPRDCRPQFVAAVGAATEAVAFLRRRHGADGEVAASPYWAESLRAFGAEAEPRPLRLPPATARHRARAQAREGRLAHEQVERALEQIDRKRLPQTLGGERRRTYSVTELEDYLRCPYGWFVRHVLRPDRPPQFAATRGTIAHEVLAEVFAADEGQRLETLEQSLKRHAAGHLSERERAVLKGQLERAVELTGSAAWPFDRHHCEVDLQLVVSDFDGGELTITGRADRVDARHLDGRPPQIMVIDYKSGRTPNGCSYVLQPYLYPAMATRLDDEVGGEVAGFVYVSLRYGALSGSLAAPIDGLAGAPGIELNWHQASQKAFKQAEQAVRGIESGQWSEIGSDCSDWCAHHLLSTTGVQL